MKRIILSSLLLAALATPSQIKPADSPWHGVLQIAGGIGCVAAAIANHHWRALECQLVSKVADLQLKNNLNNDELKRDAKERKQVAQVRFADSSILGFIAAAAVGIPLCIYGSKQIIDHFLSEN